MYEPLAMPAVHTTSFAPGVLTGLRRRNQPGTLRDRVTARYLGYATNRALKILNDGQPKASLRAQNLFLELLRKFWVTRHLPEVESRVRYLKYTRTSDVVDFRMFESAMRNFHRI